MSKRKIQFTAGGYYHVLNRGADRRPIFFCQENYEFLKRLMFSNAEKLGITIVSYCLMPNHYHMVLRQESDTSISSFMQRVFNSYSKAVNKQQGRTGTCFEERFKSKQIVSDMYLCHVVRYLHLNPVKACLTDICAGWAHSDYLGWVGKARLLKATRDIRNTQFGSAAAYECYVDAGNPSDAKAAHILQSIVCEDENDS